MPAKKGTKKTTTKSTRKTTRKTSRAKKSTSASVVMPMVDPMMESSMPMAPKKMNGKMLSAVLIVIGIALLTYKFGPWLVPAMVNNRPITRFEVWSRLEKSYGAQTIDDITNEKILDAAIAKSGVKVEQSKVDEQVKSLEDQFSALGGLDDALKQRGLTRKDLEKQVKTQLAVEMILADKITPTEDEIKAQYDAGADTTYQDKSYDEVKDQITEEIKQTKLRDEFLSWFADVKKQVKVKTFGL